MHFLDNLNPRYRTILCDAWGVIHNGIVLAPGAADRLVKWRAEGRFVVLLTNAPRPADSIRGQLDRLGLPRQALDAIVSSGEAGLAALKRLDVPVGFLGTEMDRTVLAEHGLPIAGNDDFADLACIGFEKDRWDIAAYETDLDRWLARGVRLHCLNPDRVVVYGSRRLPCAGLIAEAYEQRGGTVIWYGKPHEPIYHHALSLAGNPSKEAVLAIGDGLQTDMLGAANMGLDAVFVAGGIHAGERLTEDIAARSGFGSWRPVATVESLA